MAHFMWWVGPWKAIIGTSYFVLPDLEHASFVDYSFYLACLLVLSPVSHIDLIVVDSSALPSLVSISLKHKMSR